MNRIHKYEMNDKKIILDINSGSVHVVDEIVWDVIDSYLEKSKSEIVDLLKNKYNESSIEESYDEIEFLVEKKVLFTEDVYEQYVNYMDQNVVKALCLHVAHDCNLKCKYCFASQGDYKGNRELMSYEVGKKALDFLMKNSGNRRNLEVDFFGGEPLMNWDVVKKLTLYGKELEKEHNKNFRFTMTTNGVLLDDEKIDFLNEYMYNVVLSLDGRKEVNDNMRITANGKGSYDTIVPKFQKLVSKRGDKEYFVRGTFTNKNLDFSKDVLHYRDLGFEITSMEPAITEPDLEYALREEHLPVILEEYEKLSKEYIKIKKSGEKFDFYHFVIDLNQGPCAIRKVTGCGAGSNYMSVVPNGDIYPCHQFVDDESFKLGDVDSGIKNTGIQDEFRKVNIYNKEECKNCWARFYCSGGCMANAFHANGDIRKPYKLACEMEKKRIESAISVMANLQD